MDFLSPTYRYFFEVAEGSSIRAAADRLRISQSAVSRQIINLEQSLGYDLFDRTPRGVTLTLEGQLLIKYLRESSRLAERLQLELDEIHDVQRGHLTVAVVEGFAANGFPEVLRRFHDQHPAVMLRVMVADSAIIRDGLIMDEYDLGVIYNPRSEELNVLMKCNASLHALLSSCHPLSRRDSLSLLEIVSYPVIAPARAGGSREVFSAAERFVKYTFNVVLETNSANVAAAHLIQSDSIGILSPLSAVRYIESGQIVAVPILETAVTSGTLAVVSRSDASLSSAGKILAKMLSAAIKRMGTANLKDSE